MVKIVVGVLRDGDRYLIAQRRKGSHQEYKWEFPGGKLETSESEKEALEREFKEELDVNIQIQSFICEVVHEYPKMKVHAKAYFVNSDEKQKLQRLVHQQIKWITKDELLQVDMVDADKNIIKEILGV